MQKMKSISLPCTRQFERGTAAEVNRQPRISHGITPGIKKKYRGGLTDDSNVLFAKHHNSSPLFLFKLELGYSPSLALQHPKPTNPQAIYTPARPLGVSPHKRQLVAQFYIVGKRIQLERSKA